MKTILYEMLKPYAEVEYQQFSKKLNPGQTKVLGVRIPQIKLLAKKLAQQNNFAQIHTQIQKFFYMEEKILYGCAVAYSLLPFTQKQTLIKKLLPTCTCWAETDTLVSACSFYKQHLQEVWQDLPYFSHGTEFEQRWFFLVQMKYFLQEPYITQILKNVEMHGENLYYVNMAKAWLLCEMFIRFYNQTKLFLQTASFHPWVKHKAIQKACESCRLTPAQKQELKNLLKT